MVTFWKNPKTALTSNFCLQQGLKLGESSFLNPMDGVLGLKPNFGTPGKTMLFYCKETDIINDDAFIKSNHRLAVMLKILLDNYTSDGNFKNN